MASKNKRPHDRKGAARPAVQYDIHRLIDKGRYKDAVKEAKLVYRQESTPENHWLLEKAYFLRAQQLQQGGMTTSAQEVAGHLLEFGNTDPALTEPLAALLMALGMSGRALELQSQVESPEARERLMRQAADQAVLHPEQTPASLAEIRQGAILIRGVLDALAAGDEAKALDSVREIARNSPFSDWRLFVRGLAAFHRHESAEARANWERLEAGRIPSRIASALIAIEGSEPLKDATPPAPVPNLETLERLAFGGEAVLRPLGELAALVAQQRWAEAIRQLSPLRFSLQRIDPALTVRLTHILYDSLIRSASDMDYQEAHRLLKNFTRAAEPLPIDPRWNRLWAMVWEGPQGHIEEAEPFWTAYLDDLETTPALRPEERPQAQALIWLHVGKELAGYAEELFEEGPPTPSKVDPQLKDARRRTVECFEKSLRLFPAHRPTYEALVHAYKDWGDPDKAASINRRRIDALPDDFEALYELADYHFYREEPREALGYITRARALKPLDKRATVMEWACHTALARRLAIEGRWDEGRAEFAIAERLDPETSRGLHFLVRKAALELKAGEAERAQAIIADALELVAEPTPVWLALVIETQRFKASKADHDRFEASWLSALPKRVKSQTAGALASLLSAFLISKISYPALKEHLKQVTEYLGRTTRIKYGRDDLGQVCAFLKMAGGKVELLEKLAKRGTKLFPAAPEFLLILGSLEIEKGPRRGNLRQARMLLEQARKLAQAHAATDPRAAEVLPIIKKSLATLDDLTDTVGRFSFPFGPLPGGQGGNLYEMIEEMMDAGMVPGGFFDDDDDEDDDDFDDDDGPLPWEPAPRPRGPSKKKKRKR